MKMNSMMRVENQIHEIVYETYLEFISICKKIKIHFEKKYVNIE